MQSFRNTFFSPATFPLLRRRQLFVCAANKSSRELAHSSGSSLSREEVMGANKRNFKRGNGIRCCSIVDAPAASTLVEALQQDLEPGDTVLEMNPGPGLLTGQLLRHTEAKIVLFEKRKGFRDQLTSRLRTELNEERLTLAPLDFYLFYSIYIASNLIDNSHVLNEFLDFLPFQRRPDRSNLKIVGVISDGRFLSRLSICFALRCSFFAKVRPTFYIYVPEYLSMKYFSEFPFKRRSFFRYSLQYQFYFQSTKICQVENTSFHPHVKSSIGKRVHNIDCTKYHLVKVEPNWDFLRTFSGEEHEMFHFFQKSIAQNASSNVLLETLEKWVPGVSISLIDAGYHIHTYSHQLLLHELLLAYRLLVRHPNFQKSRFMKLKSQYIEKLQGLQGLRVQDDDYDMDIHD